MKKAIVAVSVLFLSVAVFAQGGTQAKAQKKAEDYVTFKQLKHDFGKIKQNQPVTHDFAFVNSSAQPIVIEFASASCGCTTPTWPQGAVGKGKTDKITAGFNAQAPGPFNKTITVKVAGVDAPLTLNIVGEVLTPEDYAKYKSAKSGKGK